MGVPLSQPVQTPPADQPTGNPQSPANPTSAPPAPAPQAPAGGFPADTPLAEMTADQRENYWKFHSRKHEDTVRDLRTRYADYDALAAKAAEADRLRQQVETETEKALREATEKARQEAIAQLRPALVAAEFRAASAGRIDAERLATLTEDIDLSRYLKQDGSVDLDKVTAKVDAWAPPPPPADPNEPPAPRRGVRADPSQGATGNKATGTDLGREMFEARRKRQPTA